MTKLRKLNPKRFEFALKHNSNLKRVKQEVS